MEDGPLLPGRLKLERSRPWTKVSETTNHVNQIGVSILYGQPTRAFISIETLAPTTPVAPVEGLHRGLALIIYVPRSALDLPSFSSLFPPSRNDPSS